MYLDDDRAATISSRLELVQILVEAEADPTSFAVIGDAQQSPLMMALDKLDFSDNFTRRTNIMQVGYCVSGCVLVLCSSHILGNGPAVTQRSLYRLEDGPSDETDLASGCKHV